ncbi:MAG: hypothetical protein C4297_01950 [Gemmataceae bacterium]
MRIAHFVQRYPPAIGGSEAFFARLSHYLAQHGDQVDVYTTNARDLEAFWCAHGTRLPASSCAEHGLRIRRHPLRCLPYQRLWQRAARWVLPVGVRAWTTGGSPFVPSMWAAAGRRANYAVVHATAFPYTWPILCARRLARRCRARWVLTPFLHLGNWLDPADPMRHAYLAPELVALLKGADLVIVQTRLEYQAVLAQGVPDERVRLLGMGVDPNECCGSDRVTARQRWGIAPDAVVIGHLANKSREKGTLDLLQALALLRPHADCVRLLLAGPEMTSFRDFWRALPDKQNIIRLGVLSEQEKKDFYAAIDIFALPSRSDSFGLVLLEAWANGVPCVGYRAGGIAEVIRHGTDGWLVDCGDIAGLAAALDAFVRNTHLRRLCGARGRAKVLACHAWPPLLARVRAWYYELLTNAPSPGLTQPRSAA